MPRPSNPLPSRRNFTTSYLTQSTVKTPCAGQFSDAQLHSPWLSSETVDKDPTNCALIESYLVKVDIGANVNDFIIFQVSQTFHSTVIFLTIFLCQIIRVRAGIGYASVMRRGRVRGIYGFRTVTYSSEALSDVGTYCKNKFCELTGMKWDDWRWSISTGTYNYVDLDYYRPNMKALPELSSLPDHTKVEQGCDGNAREVIELALYGGPVSKSSPTNNGTAIPYSHMSSWSIFLAYNSLLHIADALKDGDGGIKGPSILDASNLYRRQIPLAVGDERPPALTTMGAVRLELEFLYSLFQSPILRTAPWSLLSLRIMDSMEHLPLYQAFRSIDYDFSPLSDASTAESQDLY